MFRLIRFRLAPALAAGAALLLAAWLPVSHTQAQQSPVADADVRVGVRADSAFVYHTAEFPMDHGFHVERSVEGGSFERITDEPVRAVQDPRLLAGRIGAQYDAIARNMRVDSPNALFFRLRADRVAGLFLTFAYPRVARAMGRLFVDRAAPIGESVTYRVVFVNGLDQPTGRTLEHTVESLRETPAPAPRDVELSNDGAKMRADWQYPQGSSEDDQVLRFEVLRQGADGAFVPVDESRPILRNETQRAFFHLFQAERVGQTETYAVAAVQITGRRILSDPVTYYVEDNVPPAPVAGIEVFTSADSKVEVSWPVSPAPDVAGYRIFRAQSLTDDEDFEPLNDDLLDALQTAYVDSTTRPRRVYYYKVAAVDSAGNAGLLSNPVQARARDEVAPPAPTALDAAFQPDDGTVRLTWDARIPPDLHTYQVLYRRPDDRDENLWSRANPDPLRRTAYTASGIEGVGFAEGAVYRFAVAAVDSSLNESDTAFVSLKIPDLTPPPPPEQLDAFNDAGVRAVLRWSRSPALDATTYVLRRRPDAARAADTVLARTGPNELQVQDDGVESGRAYVYTVSAIDSLGNEGPRSAPVRFVMRDYSPPPAPRTVQAAARPGGGAIIAWQPVPGDDVTGYRIAQSDLPTGIFEPINDTPVTDTRFEHAAGEAGRYYRVYALDSSGNTSDASAPARAKPVE